VFGIHDHERPGFTVKAGADPQPIGLGGERALQAYLLGSLGFDALLALQSRLVYDVAGDREIGVLIVCDHPPGITVGREGSRRHIRPSPEELHARGWPVRWVGRGGGVMLHLPGQVACYPIVALDRLGLTPAAYLSALQGIVVELASEYDITAVADAVRPGVTVAGRRLAHIGAAVRDWVSCFGVVLNVDTDLEPFRDVHCDGDPTPMTSLQRETPSRVRIPGVRQRLVELVAARFGFDRVSVFHTPPGVPMHATRHAAPTHRH
jgi:lipoyl(octanoyl) transferase